MARTSPGHDSERKVISLLRPKSSDGIYGSWWLVVQTESLTGFSWFSLLTLSFKYEMNTTNLLPKILDALTFRANQPVRRGIECIRPSIHPLILLQFHYFCGAESQIELNWVGSVTSNQLPGLPPPPHMTCFEEESAASTAMYVVQMFPSGGRGRGTNERKNPWFRVMRSLNYQNHLTTSWNSVAVQSPRT